MGHGPIACIVSMASDGTLSMNFRDEFRMYERYECVHDAKMGHISSSSSAISKRLYVSN